MATALPWNGKGVKGADQREAAKRTLDAFVVEWHFCARSIPKIIFREKEVSRMEKDFKEFYTVYEVAEMLRVSDRTIRKHIDQGLLRALKVGHVYRIMRQDLEDYFERIKTMRKE